MANLTIRNLDDAVHQALKALAKSNGRSMEAEIRSILASELRKADARNTKTLGEVLKKMNEDFVAATGGLTDEDLKRFERDSRPAREIEFD